MKKIKENKIKSKDISENSNNPSGMINYDETTDNRFIQNNKKDSIIIDSDDSYKNLSLEETFLLRYSDPVNTIALTDNYLLYGSMIGKVIFYNIPKKHFYQLYELTNESIMGSSLENDIENRVIHYIAIGDESVVSIFEKEDEQDIEANTIYNYKEKDTHSANCPESFTLLWKNKALILNLHQATEYNEEIQYKNNEYTLITYEIEDKKKDPEKGEIEMTNYSVPFDYKDNIFLFLEHCPQDKRNICIYEFSDVQKEGDSNIKGKRILTTIAKNFGHISFLKILNKNLLLMVRNYNQIEIYDFESDFKMISSCNNNYEINSIDFYEINQDNEEKNDNEININLKLKQYNLIFIDVEQNIVELKFKNESSNIKNNLVKMNKHFQINVKDIDGISNDLKMRGLFDLDFPYYIKNSPHYIALTTDQACFLLKKEK